MKRHNLDVLVTKTEREHAYEALSPSQVGRGEDDNDGIMKNEKTKKGTLYRP